MKLKDIDCRRAVIPATKKQVKLFDGEGLYLLVRPSSKVWKRKYRFNGKEKTITLGKYPEVSLKEARRLKRETQQLVAQGIDPANKNAVRQQTQLSFKNAAEEWMAKKRNALKPLTAERHWRILEIHIFPWIADRNINDITPRELLDVLEKIESQGKIVTAHKAKELCDNVFQYAIVAHGTDNNPAAMLSRALTPSKPINRAALTDPKDIAKLMRAIDAYEGSIITKIGLKISAYTFVRPGELRKMEWSELHFDKQQWIIPAKKMKMKRVHIVPLAHQVVRLLKILERLSTGSIYVFPGRRSNDRCMSENTINAAIRYLGFEKDQMCAHGFRGMASTRLYEMGCYRSDVIEMQLAHAPSNAVKAAYNHAQYIQERTKMMQEWADYLDQLTANDAK